MSEIQGASELSYMDCPACGAPVAAATADLGDAAILLQALSAISQSDHPDSLLVQASYEAGPPIVPGWRCPMCDTPYVREF